MSVPDIWSLITGIASILGLLFALPKEFSAWRKYTLPITYVFGGIAIGRMSVNFSQSIDAAFQDPYLVITLIVIIVVISSTAALIVYMEKQKYTFNPFFFFLIIISFFIPYMFDVYSKITPEIPTYDYLVLARAKEQTGDLNDAITYYQKYIQNTDDLHFNGELKEKVSTLKTKQLEIINQN